MVYKPRNIDRVPFMARLRKMMHTVMEEITLVYSSPVNLPKLYEIVNEFQIQGIKLEFHQKEHVKFAQMFADFVDKLQGIRLRSMTDKELVNWNKNWEDQDKIKPPTRKLKKVSLEDDVSRNMSKQTITAQFLPARERPTPAILRKRTSPVANTAQPTVGTQPGPSWQSQDHSIGYMDDAELMELEALIKQEDDIKPEPLCEVDDTPFPLEGLRGPPGTISILKADIKEEACCIEFDDATPMPPSDYQAPEAASMLKEEIKEEELDLPSTSYSSSFPSTSFDERAVAGATAHLQEGGELEWSGADGYQGEGGGARTARVLAGGVQGARKRPPTRIYVLPPNATIHGTKRAAQPQQIRIVRKIYPSSGPAYSPPLSNSAQRIMQQYPKIAPNNARPAAVPVKRVIATSARKPVTHVSTASFHGMSLTQFNNGREQWVDVKCDYCSAILDERGMNNHVCGAL